ncbi:class I SAM-dependent methyltransferase [Streptomyces sp. SID3343]|uniref:class I SAM-dependent methyltransferase n=1 Tax=Streptomyces sp. SID3343 TaxID=2690260 RepID=UPI001368ADC4|nr:class I SAM-dependent methyltransferase [Streptomyces sp. SID3343]MYW01949.1 methyltransferase domain-containing protein [Streptomyces sp. SID3343]
MSVSDRYRSAWEGFWEDNSGEPGEPFWDADPAVTAVPHTELLESYADCTLPIVDLGCGNGTQTRYLASRYPLAVGVDLSAAAIDHARRLDPRATAEFHQVNLADADAVERLHTRLGDANVYMRAVLHQSDRIDRGPVAAAVARLVGTRGRAFVAELTGEARLVLHEAVQHAGGPSEKLRQVQIHGLRPADVAPDEIHDLLCRTGLDILAHGTTPMAMAERRPDGTRLDLPAQWFVVGRSSGDHRSVAG